MTQSHRRIVMCPPDNVTPVVPAYLRRCADCPTRVWVSVLILLTVVERGEAETLCFSCARRLIRLSDVTPQVAVLPEFERALEARGSLEHVRELAAELNSSRLELEFYAEQMERTYGR